MKTRKYLKIFTKDFQSGADKRIRSRKDELTAKCPMINSWCKTVFVPRIFRLSLSALGCKLRVRNWVNYAGRQTARHVSEIRFSHRATFTLRDILAWEGNETQWNVTKKYEGKESEVEEGGWKGWKIEREREKEDCFRLDDYLSLSLFLSLLSISMSLILFLSLSLPLFPLSCSQPERKSHCFTMVNDIRLCRWNNVLAPLSYSRLKMFPKLRNSRVNLFTSWI